jgi:UDPglucose 6-dehydrogenase
MKVAVVGTGYVGLVSGVCLAAKGHSVICVDKNPAVVQMLNAGRPHIFEIGLAELLSEVLAAARFSATQDLISALDQVELVIVAVGTPSKDGIIDLTYIKEVSREIGAYIKTHDRHISVVIKSTVVPGTTDTVVRNAIEDASGKTFPAFGLGMNPEFLREGDAVNDFANPDRIVLGHEDSRTLERLDELYAPWEVDKLRVNTRTAEMIKYANNALLATQISAINEIANLAAAVGGIDVMDVVAGVHMDKRWNPILPGGARVKPHILTYLVPGCGFGGSCFPKDVQALRSQGMQNGLSMRMLNAVLDVNEEQPEQVIEVLLREPGGLASRKVLVLGLAFKPGTDDVRESASLKIVARLAEEGAQIVAHDPIATENFRKALNGAASTAVYCARWQDEVAGADIVIVATSWPEYQALRDFDLKGKVLFDARRAFPPTHFQGATYLSIGRQVTRTSFA